MTSDDQVCANVSGVAGSFAVIECDSNDDCDDGMFCSGIETCVDNACVAGTPPCDPATESSKSGGIGRRAALPDPSGQL